MQVNVSGLVVDVDFNVWEFEGRSGTAYYMLIKDETKKLQKVKLTEEQYKKYQNEIGSRVDVMTNIFIKGSYTLQLDEQ